MADVRIDFLRIEARKPWRWGVCDCCLFLADWIAYRDGFDPAADLRGTYSTEREMRRLVKERGGIFAVVERCAKNAGLEQTDEPAIGDVGLVQVPIKFWRERAILVPAGAIKCSDKLWAVKSREHATILMQPFPVLRAWGA